MDFIHQLMIENPLGGFSDLCRRWIHKVVEKIASSHKPLIVPRSQKSFAMLRAKNNLDDTPPKKEPQHHAGC